MADVTPSPSRRSDRVVSPRGRGGRKRCRASGAGRHKSAKVLPRYAKRTMRQVAAGQKKKRLSRTEADDCQNDNSRVVRIVGTKWRKSLKTLERVKEIEPSSSAWKAVALPLSYSRERQAVSEIGPAGSHARFPLYDRA